jgi:hypothetical protein
VHLIGVSLIGVHLIGVSLIGVHLLSRASLTAMYLIGVHLLQAFISQAARSALISTYRVAVRGIHCGFHAQFSMGKASDPPGK